MGALEKAIADIASMRVRGAGRIGRCAAEALGKHTVKLRARDFREFRREMLFASRRLAAARPTAVSLSNAVGIVMKAMPAMGDIDDARRKILQASERFCSDSDTAVERLGKHGAELVPDGCTVMTICNSSAAISVIAHAKRRVREAIACETRPRYQGRITARALAEGGIRTTIIVDSASRFIFGDVDAVFVGTDAIEWDGSVINKIGTLQLAACARDHKVPFYACAESYKFCPPSQAGKRRPIEERDGSEVAEIPGVRVRNPVFDRTPPQMVTRIITEHGAVKPSEALAFSKRHLGGL